MAYTIRVQNITTFRFVLGERADRYSDDAILEILSHQENCPDRDLDGAEINCIYHEADNLYCLLHELVEDPDTFILSAEYDANSLVYGNGDISAEDAVLSALATPPADMQRRFPSACPAWFTAVHESAVGDCFIGDVAIDFLVGNWDGYDKLEAIAEHPTLGKDSKAMSEFRSNFLAQHAGDEKVVLEALTKTSAWQHDYMQYRILKNGHILYW